MSVNFLLILFVLIVVAMIAFILVQKGSGATAGSAFGSGASSTVFGAKGSGNFLTKTTMILAFLFFAISMLMAVNASKTFTTGTTGEVDLGVIGKLDTNETDVPTMTPTGNVKPEVDSDVPKIEVKTTSDNVKVETTAASDVPQAQKPMDKIEDMVNKAVDNAKGVKQDIKQDIIKKAEEVKDKIDG